MARASDTPPWVRAAARHVLRNVDRVAAGQPLSAERLTRIVISQLVRPERPLARLTPPAQRVVKRWIEAQVTDADGKDRASQAAFIWKVLTHMRAEYRQLDIQYAPHSRLAGIKAALETEMAASDDADYVLQRALTRYVRGRGRAKEQGVRLKPKAGDALAELLCLPEGQPLPPGDMRLKLVKTFQHMPDNEVTGQRFIDAVRQAAAFAPDRLRTALGPHLWRLGQPVGYADRRQEQLLVQVESSAAAQELAFQKVEILQRMRRLPGFDSLRDVRFVVVTPSPDAPRPVAPEPPPAPTSNLADLQALLSRLDEKIDKLDKK